MLSKSVKFLIFALVVLSNAPFAYASTLVISPSSGTSNSCSDYTLVSVAQPGIDYFRVFSGNPGTESDPPLFSNTGLISPPQDLCSLFAPSTYSDGLYWFIEANALDGDQATNCEDTDQYNVCTLYTPSDQEFLLTIGGEEPPPEESTSIAGLIATASSTIFADFGFGLGDISDLMKVNMLLVMGSATGVIQQLLPFILVIVIISSIVYFIYRGFRFFKN